MLSKTIKLSKTQNLSDRMQNLEAGTTLVVAPTGVGKTTWVLKNLTKQGTVLMLVPLVLQIDQLMESYASDTSIVFLKGGMKPSVEMVRGKSIVATYDLLPVIQKLITISEYTLVIDEVHKLYSAGSYRDEALNPVLDLVRSRKARKTVLCTATYTPHLLELAQIVPDTLITCTMTTAQARSLEVRVYSESSPLHWLAFVRQRLAALKAQQVSKIILVRLNSRQRIETTARWLRDQGFTVLEVNRSRTGIGEVNAAMKSEALPNVDVVLTTSIMDEAINLNNPCHEIDSVHLADGTAHPEEIVQFMGRLRKANPPFFMHLSKGQSAHEFLDESNAMDWAKNVKRLKAIYHSMTEMGSAMKRFAEALEDKSPEQNILFIREINQTVKRFAAGNVLREEYGPTIKLNEAGFLAACYRQDLRAAYQSYVSLTERLCDLLPEVRVSSALVEDAPPLCLKQMLADMEALIEKDRCKAAKAVCSRIKSVFRKQKPNDTLQDYAMEMERLIKEGVEQVPYNKEDEPHHYRSYFEVLQLAQCLVHMKDIRAVMMSPSTQQQVLEVGLSCRDHFARAIRQALRKMAGKKPNWGYKLDAKQAISIFRNGLAALRRRNWPVEKILSNARLKGLSKNEHNRWVIPQSLAFNTIARLAYVEDKNSHKPTKRYLVVRGEYWGGYEYVGAGEDEIFSVNTAPSSATSQELEEISVTPAAKKTTQRHSVQSKSKARPRWLITKKPPGNSTGKPAAA